MSTPKNESNRAAIRGALVQRAGDAPDGGAVAKATLELWNQVVTLLAPVIGTRGVEVLFSRSLHLTGRDYPLLAMAAGDQRDMASLLGVVNTRLASCEMNEAVETSHSLLVNYTELLSTLIGESLTEQLLRPAWAVPPLASVQETES